MRNTGPSQKVRAQVRIRSNSLCERCGYHGAQVHHRRPRKSGGTRRPEINYLSNLVLLCLPCHLWVESHRGDSYALGWLVHEGDDTPDQIPLTDLAGRRFFLTDDGTVIYLNGTTHDAA